MNEQRVIITLFGATGDLAHRKLYPALFRLYQKGLLKEHFAVIGTARRPWTDDYFREIILQSINSTEEIAKQFVSHFYYCSHNVEDAAHYVHLKQLSEKLDTIYQTNGNRLFYLSVSPNFFGVITTHLKQEQLLTTNGYNRLIIEKPFGHDYESAKQLNDLLSETFDENQIFRIDHYIGKEMLQNILALRFANPQIEATWNKQYIDHIQITMAENVSVEERGGYYDTSGALRDMIQNHALQIVALLTMEKPASFEQVRQQKIKALQALLSPTPRDFVRGQYGPSLDGVKAGYREDEHVDAMSNMETFVAGKLQLNTPQFLGVPIYVRTGKNMGKKETVIHVVYKKSTDTLFDPVEAVNRLSIHVAPFEGYRMHLTTKEATQGYHLQETVLENILDKETIAKSPEAYERLIFDCMRGDSTNFTHWEEVAASWQFVDPIRENWDTTTPTDFPNYPAGVMGPITSYELLEQDGRQWIE